MTFDLPLVFTALMAFAMLAYVVLDGYDLGVGMLLPAATPREQNVMVSSIGPFWDANETWLVLGVGLLLVAFPAAHGEVLTALYMPVLAMLAGLVLRGVAFELRVKAEGWHRELWNRLFWFGSLVAALAQGVMLARYLTGFQHGAVYHAFAALVAGGVCGGYILLGAGWMVLRAEGELQRKALRWVRWGLAGVALAVVLVTIATPLESSTIRARWLQWPRAAWLALLPLGGMLAWLWAWRACARMAAGEAVREWIPFAAAVLIHVSAFAGLAFSLFPYVIIDRMTIWEAAAHPSALAIVLAGALVVLPLIVLYSAYSYYVFRGKAREKLYE
jgi:cytochrome d ubiquinol oxidase subunit II